MDLVDLFDLVNKPGIDLREIANFGRRQATLNGGEQPMDAIGPRRGKFLAK